MKTLLVFAILALGSVSMPALAANPDLICEEDLRPTDGSYAKFEVKFLENGRANVYLSVISSGYGPTNTHDSNFKNRLIATSVVCQYTGTRNIALACFVERNPNPVITVGYRDYYGTRFVEVKKNDQLVASFEPSACKSRP